MLKPQGIFNPTLLKYVKSNEKTAVVCGDAITNAG
jgi:hypothetical protein